MMPTTNIDTIPLQGLIKKLDLKTEEGRSLQNVITVFKEKKISISDNQDPRTLTLDQMMLCMLNDLNRSYILFNKIPPGTHETISIINKVLSCNDDEERTKLMRSADFCNRLTFAMEEVNSVKSSLNYVKAGLKILAGIALILLLTAIIAAAFFALGYYLIGLVPVTGVAFNAMLCFWYSTYSAAGEATINAIVCGTVIGMLSSPILACIGPFFLIRDAINQISRTHQERNTPSAVNSFSLFKSQHEAELLKRPSELSSSL